MESPYIEALRRKVDAARQLQADMATYEKWLDGEAKDCQVNFRIAKADLAQFKALAKSRRMKYQTLLREIIKREIRLDDGGSDFSLSARVGWPY